MHSFVKCGQFVKQVPLAAVLMSRRQKVDYVAAFAELKRILVTYSMDDCLLDFEMATWISLRENFPGITIHGYLFHYQAIYRRVGLLGLIGEYKQEGSEVRELVKKLFTIPLLPHRKMVDSFKCLLTAAESPEYHEKLSQLLFQ